MILEFETQDELILAFITYGGTLNGYVPEKGLDTNKVSYPCKIEINDDKGTFKLYEEPKVEEQIVVETKKKSNKKLILGLSIGIPVSILVIVGIVLMCIYL